MKIILDGTPLLGRRTGIGRYTYELLGALPDVLRTAESAAQVGITLWSARGRSLPALPPAVQVHGGRVPARLLRELWLRFDHPTIELTSGSCDVFHGTNFVSPPTRRAAEVVTIHDLTYLNHKTTVTSDALQYQALVQRAVDRGAHVLTPTESVAAEVRNHYGLQERRTHVTPLGVDLKWFDSHNPSRDWRTKRGIPEDYLLFVGSLDPRKNLDRLLDAHRRARSSGAHIADLVLAGPAGRTHVEANSGVHVTGWLTDEELRHLVAGSRALVLPSLDEGFGLPVIEALACGRPVVISRIPALQEVANSDATLCDPLDTDSIAQALTDVMLIEDSKNAIENRQAWASRFTWGRTAELTVVAYGEAIEDHK